MQRFVGLVMIAGLFCGLSGRDARAQMFGNRTFGASLQPQASAGGGTFGGPTPAPGIGATGTPGAPGSTPAGTAGSAATGAARFLRQNRSTQTFVGKDSKGLGAIDGQPAAAEVVERRVPESLLNPPRTTPPRTRMYEPRLSVGFPVAARMNSEISANLQNQVRGLNQTDPSLRVTTTVVGQTVRLEGTVATEAERALIEQVMLFEPGISAVQNDLTVLSSAR